MYQSDWILRQIEMLGVLVKRMLEALHSGSAAEALEMNRTATGELVDSSSDLVDALTGEGLVTLLSAGGELDVFRAHTLGELLAVRAEALDGLGRQADAAYERGRALTLLRAALSQAEGEEAARVKDVISWLEEDVARAANA